MKTEDRHIEKLLQNVKNITFEAGKSIPNVSGKGYFFIYSGKIKETGSDGISKERTTGYFGSEKEGESVAVTFVEETAVGFIPADALLAIIGGLPSSKSTEPTKKMLTLNVRNYIHIFLCHYTKLTLRPFASVKKSQTSQNAWRGKFREGFPCYNQN